MTPSSHQEASKLKIIIALASRIEAEEMAAVMKGQGHEPLIVSSGAEALEAISKENYGLGILDAKLADMDGLTLCLELRDRQEIYMPMIILASKAEVESGLASSEIGADDYLPQPYSEKELLSRIKVLARMRNFQKELCTKLEMTETSYTLWRNVALTDHLTKLFNRYHLEHCLASEFEGHLRYGHPLSLILINLDRFRLVNDTYGQSIGDWLLRRMGDLFADTFRKADTVGRYSGREFAVIMPHCPQEEAVLSAERIRRKVADTTWESPMGELSITLSIGVAGLPPSRVRYSSELIDLAHEALVLAKDNGRNRVEFVEIEAD